MTPGEFKAFATRLSFGAGLSLWKPSIRIALAAHEDALEVTVQAQVPDRLVCGEPVPLLMTECFALYYLEHLDERAAMALLLGLIRKLVIHEMDESIRFDGVILQDRHAAEQRDVLP